jgi:conjugal transfer pilus assembly protein TraV
MARASFSLIALTACGVLLAGCASNTKGSWACKVDEGRACASIDQIDHDEGAPHGKRKKGAVTVDGAGVAKWWDRADGYAQPPIKGPRREGDQVMRLVVAPWVDAIGDYHGRTEIFAVMRKGAWWVAPAPVPIEPPPASAAAPAASPVSADDTSSAPAQGVQ